MIWVIQASIVLVAAWLGWWLVWVPILVWFTISYRGWGLVVGIVIIDAYYGAFATMPWQSLLAVGVVATMELIRPYLYTGS